MKLSTLALAATFAFASSSAFSKDVTFKMTNDNLETQVCYTAATQGLDAAKALLEQNDIRYTAYAKSVTCNGSSIKQFASEHNQAELGAGEAVKIALVAKDTNLESQLCLDAVVIGEEAARAKYNVAHSVLCNGRELSVFVSKYADQEVELRSAED